MPRLRTSLMMLCGLSAVALMFAFALEYVGGYLPCRMCWWQRYPYFAILLVGAFGIVTKRETLALVVILVLLAVEVGLAGYHAGVEAGLFALPEGCAAGNQAQSVAELRMQLLSAAPSCDQISLSFASLSLSAWNAIFAFALTVAAAFALGRDWARR